jgi:hypothetical protein
MDNTDFFASTYSLARDKFLAAARATGARLSTYIHPTQTGPDGESLSVDVAHLGVPTASRQLLVISGTHGLEGYAGSAAQLAWLQLGNSTALPRDLGVLLVHGLNPFGFAHFTRTTENNVDLNRNFVDHGQAIAENPDYERLHLHLKASNWGWEFLDRMAEAEAQYRTEFGADALFNARVKGQYSYADGLFYGGNQREWSNLVLERIVHEHLTPARQVVLIDWHTGLGKYGEPFFLSFSPADSDEYRQATRWWGRDRIENARPHGLARPAYSGLVFHGVASFLGGRPLAGAVIEFGTREIDMNKAQPLDQWLRFRAPRNTERFAQLQLDLRDAYVPFSQEWRRRVICESVAITEQAIAGLATWEIQARSENLSNDQSLCAIPPVTSTVG